MKDLDIALVGAGIAGLTAAIALAKSGQSVSLYEAAPAWGDVGAGITLAPNAMRGLDYIGVGEAIAEIGIEPSTQQISHWQSGETLLMVDRSQTRKQYNSAYVYIHRADLHQVLVAEAEKAGVKIHLGKSVQSVNYQGLKPVLNFADNSRVEAELIIGADGLKSQVRQLFDSVAPHFTGHIAYRALAPITPEIQHLIDQPGMHIGPGKMIVRYPLRKGQLLNLVFFARQDGWTEDGWSIPAELQELRDLYAGWSDEVGTLIDSIRPGTVFKWAINAHSPLPQWSIENKVTLIGDAAHAMTPFLGQGAATGIEDAVILARILQAAETTENALSRYQAVRHERTTFIQKESNENADRLQGEAAELYGLGNLRNEETLGLFKYDCITESI
ncbi:MAG: FAD-dependent monooxygenase [Aliiglaciecola sp.]|uniref:FAD-dependent monooxygenase n=1 Tax=Aliiglaciecola sp. TaxID=1872441 RepID=UPI003299C176